MSHAGGASRLRVRPSAAHLVTSTGASRWRYRIGGPSGVSRALKHSRIAFECPLDDATSTSVLRRQAAAPRGRARRLGGWRDPLQRVATDAAAGDLRQSAIFDGTPPAPGASYPRNGREQRYSRGQRGRGTERPLPNRRPTARKRSPAAERSAAGAAAPAWRPAR